MEMERSEKRDKMDLSLSHIKLIVMCIYAGIEATSNVYRMSRFDVDI